MAAINKIRYMGDYVLRLRYTCIHTRRSSIVRSLVAGGSSRLTHRVLQLLVFRIFSTRQTWILYRARYMLPQMRLSVRPSVCLSDGWISQK